MKSNTMYLNLRVGESVRLGEAQITLAVKSGQRASVIACSSTGDSGLPKKPLGYRMPISPIANE